MHILKLNKPGSAKDQISIKSVQNNILMLPGNRYRAVIETSAVNFELKSDSEQDALIETYQSFLNGLNSPFQIIIRIREIDLDNYLEEMHQKSLREKENIYRSQIENYAKFVAGLVNVNKILSRRFYVVVPVDISSRQDEDFASEQLALKVEIISRGLKRLGMNVRQLESLEILELFYGFYNPGQAKVQPLSEKALSLMHMAIVKERP